MKDFELVAQFYETLCKAEQGRQAVGGVGKLFTSDSQFAFCGDLNYHWVSAGPEEINRSIANTFNDGHFECLIKSKNCFSKQSEDRKMILVKGILKITPKSARRQMCRNFVQIFMQVESSENNGSLFNFSTMSYMAPSDDGKSYLSFRDWCQEAPHESSRTISAPVSSFSHKSKTNSYAGIVRSSQVAKEEEETLVKNMDEAKKQLENDLLKDEDKEADEVESKDESEAEKSIIEAAMEEIVQSSQRSLLEESLELNEGVCDEYGGDKGPENVPISADEPVQVEQGDKLDDKLVENQEQAMPVSENFQVVCNKKLKAPKVIRLPPSKPLQSSATRRPSNFYVNLEDKADNVLFVAGIPQKIDVHEFLIRVLQSYGVIRNIFTKQAQGDMGFYAFVLFKEKESVSTVLHEVGPGHKLFWCERRYLIVDKFVKNKAQTQGFYNKY